ncbi:hypothetical protein OH76DRAFT_1260860 [Lentinus brumalis]|uniref:Uncharacterized protein n=1 Tax=Lentinus brumalis TaxID=2498619 RepID=A0A371CR93_9APHY|nr:hypothetical protein OH76DRAFT_1260860 [Polyporus brumalis]
MLGKRGMQAGVCKTCAFPSSTTTLSRPRVLVLHTSTMLTPGRPQYPCTEAPKGLCQSVRRLLHSDMTSNPITIPVPRRAGIQSSPYRQPSALLDRWPITSRNIHSRLRAPGFPPSSRSALHDWWSCRWRWTWPVPQMRRWSTTGQRRSLHSCRTCGRHQEATSCT